MISLGIEGTAHTCGIGIFEYLNKDYKSDYKILADVRKIYHPHEGGINPVNAANFIAENVGESIKDALVKSGLGLKDIDLIAFSQGPGLGPCLRMTATAARTLALCHKIPLIGVNHCVAHIEIGKFLGGFYDPLVVYVSGGNTQILKLRDKRYRIFGETMDIGVGNMLDKFGRNFNIKHPCGPKIELLAKEGKKFIKLPYTVKGSNLSFSGLLTSALRSEGEASIEDMCFSLQETAFSMITEVSERALAHLNAFEVILTGGVGNNKRLCEMLRLMAEEHKARFSVPEGFCSDNGVMIAYLGMRSYGAGLRQEFKDTRIKTRFRTDTVDVLW